MKARPKFLVAGLIIIVIAVSFQLLFTWRMGEDRIRKSIVIALEKNSQIQSLPDAQKEDLIDQQFQLSQILVLIGLPLSTIMGFIIGGLIYWLGMNAMGGSATSINGLSVWIYSSLPPTLVATMTYAIVLFIKPPDEINLNEVPQGLLVSNLSFFIDGNEFPLTSTVLATFDMFTIWGLVLATIGLKVVGGISKFAAGTVAFSVTLFWMLVRIIGAVITNNPM